MDAQALVKNFVNQHRKPFALSTIACMTSLKVEQIYPLLSAEVSAGRVREIEPGLYLVVRRDTTHSRSISNSYWCYKVDVAVQMLDLLRGSKYISIRQIAADMGVSRQFVLRYLEALASIGAVKWTGLYYKVTGRGDISLVGCFVQKGILSKMRGHNCGAGKAKPHKRAAGKAE